MHVVAWLPDYDYAQLDELIECAQERGLGLYTVASCYHRKPEIPGLILGYCGLPEAELREAMRLFGSCLDTIDARRHAAA
jgi:GntR family transcriptional regulator/MocR family aminotransferase